MSRRTLFAYVDGADLEDVAWTLDARFKEFVGSRNWVAGHPSLVNQRHADQTCTQPGDLPLWDLGLNLELPDSDAESPNWFADVEAVVRFLGQLRREFGRSFVIGVAYAHTGITEDLFYVSTDSPDLGKLRAIFAVESSQKLGTVTAIERILNTGNSDRSGGEPMPTEDEFRRVEADLGFRFPGSYREFVRLGGLSELCLTHRVLRPSDVLQSSRYLPDREHVPFADNGCGDFFAAGHA